MKRILVLSVMTLAVLGGVASADRHRGRGHGRWSGGWSGGWNASVRVNAPRVVVTQPRVVVQQRPVYVQHTRVVRRPIYVAAPRLRVRYYNYYQQPTVLAENYQPMTGYYWVAGQWNWDGYEWRWTAGHYEPDPNYVDPSYSQPSYDDDVGYSGNYDYDDDSDSDCHHNRY